MEPSSRLWIDAEAVSTNARLLRARLPVGCVLGGVIKADAYGLGLLPIARALVAGGAAMLIVYDPAEAAALLAPDVAAASPGDGDSAARSAGDSAAPTGGHRGSDAMPGPGGHADDADDADDAGDAGGVAGVADRPVLLLGPLLEPVADPGLLAGAARGRLHLTVASPRQVEIAAALARTVGRPVPVHVEVDTGMARAGCEPREAARLVAAVLADPRLRLAGVSTHMADADDDATVRGQAAVFRAVLDGLPPLPGACRLHVANTRTVLRHPSLAADMARCGQGWAGFGGHGLADPPPLRRVVRWTSRLVHVRTVEAGQGVGYGRRWRADRPSRIGLVPVGYADGLPRSLAGETDGERMHVGLGAGTATGTGTGPASGPGGRPLAWAPVIGAISMDQIMVDLTNVPAGIDLSPGAAVELVGRDPAAMNDLGRLAAAAGTTHYELLCRIGPRVRRVLEADADRGTMPQVAARPA